jgi:hypothetical protein
MAWEAHTNFRQLGIGTSLHLVESPTVVGYPPSPIQIGAVMAVEFGPNTRGKVTVLSASQYEMVIQEPAGKIWRLTPWEPSDSPVRINSPGLNWQDWVIRSEIQP